MKFLRFALLLLSVATLAGTLLPTQAWAEKKGTLKVFILAGQSNMQGHGRIEMGNDGDLDYAAKQEQFTESIPFSARSLPR